MATVNPFHYGTPATGANFTGRRTEVEAIVERMVNRVSVSLISPRRFGKTSILLRAEAQAMRHHGASVVHIDVLKCRDLPSFASQLATQAFHGRRGLLGRGREALTQFIKRFRVAPEVTMAPSGTVGFKFNASLAPADADHVIEEVYRFLETVSKERPAVLVLDEFQAVVDKGAHLPDFFKGLADTYPDVVLVLAGSKRHMMERLVTAPSAPLFRMTQSIALGPIDQAEMGAYLVRRSDSGGKKMSADVAQLIIDLAGPVPNDIQCLAYEAFAGTSGKVITEDKVRAGMRAVVSFQSPTYATVWSNRPGLQQRVLAALADSPESAPYGKEFARVVGAPTSSIQRAVEALDEDELIAERDGVWWVADAFFASWIRSDQ